MAGSVYKQCKHKGCRRSPRCTHPWWLSFTWRRKRHRMKADDFAKKPVPSKTEAEQVWLPKFITEVREGNAPTAVAAPRVETQVMTVEEFVPLYIKRHCEAEGLNMDGLRHRMNAIQRRFGAEPLMSLELPGPIEDFKADLKAKGLAAASINRYLAQLRHMINWAMDRQLMERTPFLGRGRGIRFLRENNHRYRRLTEGEEPRMLEAATDDPIMTARIIGALDTGMRRGEMLLLQNKHVLWKEELIRVLAPNAKNRKERRIPISTTRLRSVLEQRAFLGPQAFVFGNAVGELNKDFRGEWDRVLAKAEITDKRRGLDGDLHWHDLRHECGSRLAERGVPLHEIQYLLGHASLATTQRYLNPTIESLKKSIKVLEQEAV